MVTAAKLTHEAADLDVTAAVSCTRRLHSDDINNEKGRLIGRPDALERKLTNNNVTTTTTMVSIPASQLVAVSYTGKFTPASVPEESVAFDNLKAVTAAAFRSILLLKILPSVAVEDVTLSTPEMAGGGFVSGADRPRCTGLFAGLLTLA